MKALLVLILAAFAAVALGMVGCALAIELPKAHPNVPGSVVAVAAIGMIAAIVAFGVSRPNAAE